MTACTPHWPAPWRESSSEEGQAIEAGEVVAVLEAMKMETEITAPHSGVVASVLVAPGDAVSGGQLLLEFA